MVDEIKYELEPIEEDDSNLKNKFSKKVELNAKQETLEEKNLSIGEKTERKEGEVENDSTYSRILSQVPKTNQIFQSDDVEKDAKSVDTAIDAESKINTLVEIAETKGIFHAVKVARHMEDNYTLDEFHDRLLGEELHKALVAKGVIKEL